MKAQLAELLERRVGELWEHRGLSLLDLWPRPAVSPKLQGEMLPR